MLVRLRNIVGQAHVLTEADATAGYARDWTGRFVGTTPAVVRPGTVGEVAAVLALCNEAGVAVVPQGGNTGLVGGSVPLGGEVVLSLRRLDALGEVDQVTGQVTAGAGVTLEALQRHAALAGAAFGVDLGARASATVGGMVATNAGGLHFVRHGGMREQVLGLEAVLADGTVISHLGGLWKDNTGYDWSKWLCGSEGTLAVVTQVRLRLVPRYSHHALALLAFPGARAAVAAGAALRATLADLDAAELFVEAGLDLVCRQLGLPRPFTEAHGAFLLVGAAGHEDPLPALAAAVESTEGLVDAAVADPGRYEQLWAYRERHTEAINLLGAPHKLDVTLPGAGLADFIETVPGVVAQVAPQAQTWLFGHVADGNIHVNITGVAPEDDAVDDAVLRYVAACGGSISAEHGIGTAKKPWLHLNRSEAEVALFRSVKSALDPRGVLNPNVLLP
ncbi:MAG: FAD-binding protein [Acidimicrobiia bacterium]|nr:FAD-binding protein [Acidimicrobiia bacterium]